jgi:hypothetical protein
MPVIEKTPEEKLLEQVNGYGLHWSYEVTEENIREDEDFLYLEIETEDDIHDEFMELGNYLEARSTGTVNGGERYVLSVEK